MRLAKTGFWVIPPWAAFSRMTMLALALVSLPFALNAQTFPCSNAAGSGERMVGMAPGGPGVPPTPLCVRDSAPSGAAQQESDPARGMANAVMGMAKILAGDAAKMANDPLYQRLRDGYWQYFEPHAGAKPGDNCVAVYGSLQGLATIAGPSGDYRGATLAFTGAGLPRAKKDDVVKVTLDDGDGDPQTVRAYRYATPGTELVTIAFAVPTADALLGGIEDQAHYRLFIDKKQVFEINWHGGHQARDRLQQCIASAPAR
ncbi:hypothetical protein GGR77_001721 [Xanthomonas translucens]